MALLTVDLTRTELAALQETTELTPVFEGRAETRRAIRDAIDEQNRNQHSPLQIEERSLAALLRRTVPVDYATSVLRSKLDRALRAERFSAR